MISEKITQKFKEKYPDYELPLGILFKNDDKALYKYGEGVVLEIGTYQGLATVILSLKAKEVYTVDAFFQTGPLYRNGGYTYEIIKEKLSHYNNINLIKGKSDDVVIDKKFDTIFIDGGHEYNQVKKDYDKFSKQLNKNGYLLFHDCFKEYQGILQLCDEIIINNEMRFIEKIGVINIFKNENNSIT